MKKRKISITAIIIGGIIILPLALWGGYKFMNFLSGSLPLGTNRFAERYEFHCSEPTLINAIEKFKEQNPKYLLPKVEFKPNGDSVHLQYIEWDSNLNKYYLYLYNSEKNKIICFLIGTENNTSCELDFRSINEGLTLGNWKQINKDFKDDENKEEIKEFEENILNKLGIDYKRERNILSLY